MTADRGAHEKDYLPRPDSWSTDDDDRSPSLPRVLSLCDRTGVMVEPWARAGYPCTTVDLQEGVPIVTPSARPNVERVVADVTKWLPPLDNYGIVFAFPPCTHLAKSGARWWKDKGLAALIEALEVVEACRRIAEWTGAPYLIENPSGALSTHWRKPDHAFDPLDYGAYVLDGEDYTKLTNLWVGGGFVMPPKLPVRKSDKPNPIHWAAPGPERANIRSVTPRGFAQAVYEFNAPEVRRRHEEAA